MEDAVGFHYLALLVFSVLNDICLYAVQFFGSYCSHLQVLVGISYGWEIYFAEKVLVKILFFVTHPTLHQETSFVGVLLNTTNQEH